MVDVLKDRASERTELPFEAAVSLLKSIGRNGTKVKVQLWLADAIDGPAIEMRGFVSEVQAGQAEGDERCVAVCSDDWHVALDESRARFALSSDGTVIGTTKDGNDVSIHLG